MAARPVYRRPPPHLTSRAGRNILVDEVRMGIQADSGRALGLGRKRKYLSIRRERDERENQGFAEELAHDPAAAGPDDFAQADLPRPPG